MLLDTTELENRIVQKVVEELKPLLNFTKKNKEDIIFDSKETAEYLKISIGHLRNLAYLHKLPHTHLPTRRNGGEGELRFSKLELDRMLADKHVPEG